MSFCQIDKDVFGLYYMVWSFHGVVCHAYSLPTQPWSLVLDGWTKIRVFSKNITFRIGPFTYWWYRRRAPSDGFGRIQQGLINSRATQVEGVSWRISRNLCCESLTSSKRGSVERFINSWKGLKSSAIDRWGRNHLILGRWRNIWRLSSLSALASSSSKDSCAWGSGGGPFGAGEHLPLLSPQERLGARENCC